MLQKGVYGTLLHKLAVKYEYLKPQPASCSASMLSAGLLSHWLIYHSISDYNRIYNIDFYNIYLSGS